MVITVTLAVILATCWIVYKLRRWDLDSCGEKLPGDRAYPIIGTAWKYLTANSAGDIATKINETATRYRDFGLVREWMGNNLFVFVSEPRYIEVIATSPSTANKSSIYETLFSPFATGIFATSQPVRTKILKKPLTKNLTKGRILNEYHSIFLKRAKTSVEHLKKKCGTEIEISKEMNNLKLDIFAEANLGVYTNEVGEGKFLFLEHINRLVDELTSVRLKLGALFNLTKAFAYKNFPAAQRFLKWVLEERMKIGLEYDRGEYKYYSDFVLKRKEENNMTMNEAILELVDLVFAGSGTTAVISSSALLFLAMHPEIQEEAYQEQLSILGEDPLADPTPEDLSSMVVLNRIIKETMRLTGPPVIVKEATADILLDTYRIPKGTHLVISLHCVSEDPRFWERPTSFFPDHFLPEKEAERPYYAFTPFGIGPRICPGMLYGSNSIAVTLSYFLRNFKLSTIIKYEDIIHKYSLLREFESYPVKLEERCLL